MCTSVFLCQYVCVQVKHLHFLFLVNMRLHPYINVKHTYLRIAACLS